MFRTEKSSPTITRSNDRASVVHSVPLNRPAKICDTCKTVASHVFMERQRSFEIKYFCSHRCWKLYVDAKPLNSIVFD